MKRTNVCRTLGAALLAGGSIWAASALAQPSQGGTYGPGNAMGYGMMGGGYGGGNGNGYGPGMMGGYGPGYGMGPGQLGGGYGPDYGMGSGMMGGYGNGSGLDLTTEQRSKIAKIQNDVRRKHWELMGRMQDEQAQMNEQYYSENRDDAALSASYRKMSDLQYQMFDLSLSAQRQIDAVLTKEQRERQKRG
jgi:Spy/CpxP family protein refolding chaperone